MYVVPYHLQGVWRLDVAANSSQAERVEPQARTSDRQQLLTQASFKDLQE